MADEETDKKADEEAIDQAAKDRAGTASTRWRWKWLSTLTAGAIIVTWLSLMGAILAGWATLGRLDAVTIAVLHTAFGTALVYALGTEALRAWREANVAGGDK